MTTAGTGKAKQADYYDHHVADPEFEINRPHGESRLYRYLMDFKFAHVLHLLKHPISGSSVLVVCCGSGMDAEYVARARGKVVAMDISAGCLERARVRAERYEVNYDLVRGDAENLPFRDGSFDYAFVHDGLHHLPLPANAVAEMARVSRRGIMIIEPADAVITKLLIRARLMKPYEEAGNYVLRFQRRQLEVACQSLGFDRVSSSRYLMKYGHPPGNWWRRHESRTLFEVARAAFWVAGVALFGRWGNKLAFVAERSDGAIPRAPT